MRWLDSGDIPLAGGTSVSSSRPLRVLIVDDEPLIRELLAMQLTKTACTVEQAGDGATALAMMRDEQFDVLITDWQMPVMDGVALMRLLRRQPPNHYLHLIMMTTHAAHRTVQAALDVEVDAFLYKPVDAVQLELALGSARRIVALERRLRRRNRDLIAASGRARRAHDRIKADLVSAGEVQRGILPAPQPTGVFRHAGLYVPSYDLGGDSYDVVTLGDDRTFFFLLDVCGHGVQAALRSFLIHHRLRALAPSTPEALSALARELNELLIDEQMDSYFTMACGVVDQATGSCWLLSAGHPFPLLSTSAGVIALREGGPPIGLFPGLEYEVNHLVLGAGERLVLYSDGVIDCGRSVEGRLGLQGLTTFLSANAALPLEQLLSSLEQHLVSAYRGGRGFDDDLSVLVIER